MSKVDLHIHSTASDGKFSPAEIVRKSAELGLTVIAITDHDSVNGVASALTAAKDFPQLTVIPGVEISTDKPGDEVHVLGYFIDYTDRKLLAALKSMRLSRQQRARKMIAKLNDLNINLDWQRVQEIAGSGSVGRPHVAQAMVEKGYVESLKEAFTRYIGRGAPAHVRRDKMPPSEAVKLILRSKGLPVLAHPFTIREPEELIAELKGVGLVGIETYYNNYTPDEIDTLLSLANKYNLIVSGGSDYHGLDSNVETMLGGAEVPMAAAEKLISLAEQQLPTSASS